MKKQILIAVLLLVLGLGTAAAAADSPRFFWVMPVVGIRGSGGFDIQGEDLNYDHIRLDAGFAYGLSFGYRFSSILAVEAMWTRDGTTVSGTIPATETTPEAVETLFDAFQDQLQANLLLSAGYSIGKVNPYFLFGLGMSSVNPRTDVSGFTRFSWSFGLGVEAMLGDRFGLRAQGKFVPTYINTIDEVLIEWEGGAQTAPMRNTMTQWEFQAGLFFRF